MVLSESVFQLDARVLIDHALAARHDVLPLEADDERIVVAAAERDEALIGHLGLCTGRTVQVLLACAPAIAAVRPALYAAPSTGRFWSPQDGVIETTEARLAILPPSGASNCPVLELDLGDDGDWPSLAREASAAPAGQARPVSTFTPLGEPPGRFAVPKKPITLIVEDDPDIAALLARVLASDSRDTHVVSTGTDAVQWLRENTPAFVTLDAMLPGIHGFEICRDLKRSARLGHVPVLMISAVYHGWEHARTIRETCGADAFIEKPFSLAVLRAEVARLFAEAPPAPPAPPAAVQDVVTRARRAYESGDLKHAQHAVAEWLGLAPFDARAYVIRGDLSLSAQDVDRALVSFERATLFAPTWLTAWHHLARLYDQLGFTRCSHAAWSRAHSLATGPEKAEIAAHLAQLQRSA